MTTEIEHTRRELSRDVDALYDKVSPGRVVERRKAAVKGRLASMKDSVMGTAHHASHQASSAVSSVGGSLTDAPGHAQDAARGAVDAVERRTEGSPLGAGLVAFGAGMVIAAMIPATRKEAELAGGLTDAVKESPLLDEAKAVGQEMGQTLKESATEAVDEVRSTAQDAAAQVGDEGRSAAEHVKQEAPGT